MGSLRLVVISDTHGLHKRIEIPPGDVLIHAGDLTRSGKPREIEKFDRFLGDLPHRYKVVIAGNHDFYFEHEPERARRLITNAIYLQDEGVEIEGVRFWGSPWQPWFFDWAFNLQRGAPLKEKWDLIPAGTEVLITHGPPFGFGDMTTRGAAVGCQDLLQAIRRVRPRFHIFGHIHEGYGLWEEEGVTYLNASNCNFDYEPVNPPMVIDLE